MSSADIEKHRVTIEQLREAITDFVSDLERFQQSDWYLLKFLQEHHFSVKVSVEVLRRAIQWKSQLKLHLVDNQESMEMMSRFPYQNDGLDKHGHPILIVPFGRWKIREAVDNGERERFLRHAIQMTESNQERLKSAIESSNGRVNSVIIIFDLKEYTIRQLMSRQAISTLSEWTKRSEQLYPQQLKSFYVINANRVMPILFNLLKTFMSQNTVTRVNIYDSDEQQWQRVLFEHIPLDQLSQEYGGTKPSGYNWDILKKVDLSPNLTQGACERLRACCCVRFGGKFDLLK